MQHETDDDTNPAAIIIGAYAMRISDACR